MTGVTRATTFLAGALADACLGGDWTRPALLERTVELLGRRPKWLGPVLTSVMRAYRVAPSDRPRELTAFIAGLDSTLR